MTDRHEYSPQERAPRFPGVVALLSGQSRHLARSGGSFIHRAATDLDSCGSGINPCLFPPAPPNDGNPAAGGRSGRKGGGAIAFCNAGSRRQRQKPGDHPLCNLVTPRGTKRNPTTVNFQNPRVGGFFPRVDLFFPRVCFCVFSPQALSLSLFSLEKERDRESHAGKRAIHGFFGCLKKHPRVWTAIHGFSGDAFLSKTQCWRGLAACFPTFHASTGRNAPTFLELVRNG